jgi:hypothetical protein
MRDSPRLDRNKTDGSEMEIKSIITLPVLNKYKLKLNSVA